MGILAVITKITELQKTMVVPANTIVGISSPLTVKEAYPFIPPTNAQVPPIFCQNSYTLVNILTMSSSLLETQWDIRMILSVYDVQLARAALIASAFMDQIIATFGVANKTLEGTASNTNLVGGSPTLGQLETPQGPYAYIDVHLETNVKEVVSVTP